MKNQLYLVEKAARLTCIWQPTGDARRPLCCVWVAAKAVAASAATSKDESGRIHRCA
jgi:hypothetical protein